LRAVLTKYEQAVARGASCQDLVPYALHTSNRLVPDTKPDAPAASVECKQITADTIKGFKAQKVAELGPIAVVDGAGKGARPGEVVTSLWTLDVDRKWKYVFAGYFSPQVGSHPKPGVDFEAPTKAFVAAMRRGRCDLAWKYIVAQSAYVLARKNNVAKFCTDVSASLKRDHGVLVELAGTPDPKVQKLGETEDFGFFGLRLSSGRYVTLVATTKATNATPQSAVGHQKVGILKYFGTSLPK
jgi:hypothetical protein